MLLGLMLITGPAYAGRGSHRIVPPSGGRAGSLVPWVFIAAGARGAVATSGGGVEALDPLSVGRGEGGW